MNSLKEIKIATHEGIFHSDEVVAIALIKTFVNENISVHRLPHQTRDFKEHDLVIDIGKKFDNEKYFDHHQNKPEHDGKSSAGLIFNKLKEDGLLLKGVEEELAPVIRTVDKQDLGIENAPSGHLADIISYYNQENVYSDEQQDAFEFAVEVCSQYFHGIKEKHGKIEDAKEKLSNCEKIDSGRVLISDSFIPFWNVAIFDLQEYNNVDAFLWFDENQNKWKIQQVPNIVGGFGRRGRKIAYKEPLPEGVDFIHRGEFFAVGETPEVLLNLLVNP